MEAFDANLTGHDGLGAWYRLRKHVAELTRGLNTNRDSRLDGNVGGWHDYAGHRLHCSDEFPWTHDSHLGKGGGQDSMAQTTRLTAP